MIATKHLLDFLYISNINNLKYFLFFSFLILSCSGDSFIETQPILTEYFPKSEVKSYSIKSNNDIDYLYINEKQLGKVEFVGYTLWGSFKINLSRIFKMEPYEADKKFRSFSSIDDILNIQLIHNNVENAFDFFGDIYNHSINNGYEFNLKSCEYFDIGTKDFVVYEVDLTIDSKKNSILGFIMKKRNAVFYDIGLISEDSINNLDRFFFTELINSLSKDDIKLIPNSKQIIERKSINVDEK
ncbi:MAG: hypothetical protein P1U56_16900 [Saprospiraceae bacterium]|nr:hypothetical protein [Saprospiraceae bacterium]